MKPEEHAPEPAPLVARLLARVVAAAGRYPRTVLAAALLATVASLILFAARLEYRTQRNDLINPSKDFLQRWNAYQAEFGEDVDVVVVVQGADRERMRRAVDRLAGEFERHPDQFDRIFHCVDLRSLQDRALLFLP